MPWDAPPSEYYWKGKCKLFVVNRVILTAWVAHPLSTPPEYPPWVPLHLRIMRTIKAKVCVICWRLRWKTQMEPSSFSLSYKNQIQYLFYAFKTIHNKLFISSALRIKPCNLVRHFKVVFCQRVLVHNLSYGNECSLSCKSNSFPYAGCTPGPSCSKGG